MNAKILDGKKVSARIKEELKEEVANLKRDKGIVPGLAVIIVGDDPASKIYVRNKKLACETIGIHSEEYALPQDTTQEQLLALVDELNRKKEYTGFYASFLCQSI